MVNKSRVRALVKRADFLELKAEGHIVHVNSWMIVNWRKSQSADLRCGWTFPSYIGSAVVRNRLKRWAREYFRKRPVGGFDMNVILKRKESGFYPSMKHGEFTGALEKASSKLKRAGNG